MSAGTGFKRGDRVEVRSPAEILRTLDDDGTLDRLPFMPEMLRYCGRQFTVDSRASKVCDTVTADLTSRRMADTARDVLAQAGYRAEIEVRNDTESLQPGAALALFADQGEAVRLGADQAGALRRRAE